MPDPGHASLGVSWVGHLRVPRVDHNPTDDRPSISDQKKNRKHHGEVGAENGQVGWRRAKIGRVGGSVHRLYGLGGAAS